MYNKHRTVYIKGRHHCCHFIFQPGRFRAKRKNPSPKCIILSSLIYLCGIYILCRIVNQKKKFSTILVTNIYQYIQPSHRNLYVCSSTGNLTHFRPLKLKQKILFWVFLISLLFLTCVHSVSQPEPDVFWIPTVFVSDIFPKTNLKMTRWVMYDGFFRVGFLVLFLVCLPFLKFERFFKISDQWSQSTNTSTQASLNYKAGYWY